MWTIRTLGGLAAASLTALVLAGNARALEADLAWDQARATSLVQQLHEAVGSLLREAKVEDQNIDQLTAVSSQNYLLIQDLRAIKRHTRALARRLEAGQGREESLALFERIQMVVRDAAVKKRRSPLLHDAQAQIDQARGKLEELARYYQKVPTTAPVSTPPPKGTESP